MKARVRNILASDAREYYKNTAEEYFISDKDKPMHNLSAKRLREISQTNSFENVLDIGCGTGRYFPCVYGYRKFIGVDISPEMLNFSRQKVSSLHNNGFQHVVFIESDIYEITKNIDESFDFIYSIGLIGYHIPFDREIAQMIFNLLNKNGLFLVVTVQDKLISKIRKKLRIILCALALSIAQSYQVILTLRDHCVHWQAKWVYA